MPARCSFASCALLGLLCRLPHDTHGIMAPPWGIIPVVRSPQFMLLLDGHRFGRLRPRAPLDPVRRSYFCCCARTIGTAAVAERTRKQDLSTDRGDAVHTPGLCTIPRHSRPVCVWDPAAICMQCLTDLFYLQGTRSCCTHEALRVPFSLPRRPNSAILGRLEKRNVVLANQ